MYELAIRDFIKRLRALGFSDEQINAAAHAWVASLFVPESPKAQRLLAIAADQLSQADLFA